jgi:FkbM family methyltransferase
VLGSAPYKQDEVEVSAIANYLRPEYHISAFAQACALLTPDIICEIGSLDAREACRFALANPKSTVIAFEANPENFFERCLSPEVLASRVSVQHLAISDSDGMTELLMPPIPKEAAENERALMRGIGSLLRRPDLPEARPYPVAKRTLDGFFGDYATGKSFALWLDVEGHTKAVLDGARGILAKTVLAKLELETHEYWQGQALAPEMIASMEEMGFELLATSDPALLQFDALFLRRGAKKAEIVDIIEQAVSP